MSMENQLFSDLQNAMRAGDKEKVGTLRLLRSHIKNAAIAAGGTLADKDILAILAREVKKRKESIAMYTEGGREDLAAQESRELGIISAYLPRQLSEEELKEKIAAVIDSTGAAGAADMGRVMGTLMPQVAGIADGGRVRQLVKEMLG